MNLNKAGIGLAIFILLGSVSYWLYVQSGEQEEPITPEMNVDDIRVDTDLGLITAEGIVLPLAQSHLAFQAGGQVNAVLVSEGDLVAAGDVLVQLDTTDQEIAVQQAESGLVQAQADMNIAVAALLAAENRKRVAEIGVELAEAQLALVQTGITESQINVLEKQVAAAEASLVQAVGNRDLALEGASTGAIAAAQAELTAAQAGYDAALQQYQPILQNTDNEEDEREQAQLQLNAAQANLAAAQANLDALQTGAKSGTRTAVAASVEIATNQLDAVEAALSLALAGPKPEEISIAQAGVTQAEVAVTEAELQIVQAEATRAQAEASVTEAEAALSAAQSLLNRRTLTAPISGTVAFLSAKVGQVIQTGEITVIVADLSGWQIETTDLTELGVVNLARQTEVDITIDAFPGNVLQGVVTDIAERAQEVRGDVTYRVTVALASDIDLPLRWGMTAFVTAKP